MNAITYNTDNIENSQPDDAKKLCDKLRREYNIKVDDCGIVDFKSIQKKMLDTKKQRTKVIHIL